MKILENKSYDEAQEPNTVFLDKRINRVMRYLDKAMRIIGDDEKLCNVLVWASWELDTLINSLKDENADIVYFSGSADEFLENRQRKTEDIHILADDEAQMEWFRDKLKQYGFIPKEELHLAVGNSEEPYDATI